MDQSPENEERNRDIFNANVYKNLRTELKDGDVVVNVPDCISLMFFNRGVTAYESFSKEEIEALKVRKVPLTALGHVAGKPLPDYILAYPYLHILHQPLK